MSDRTAVLRAVGEYSWRVPPDVVARIADELARLEVLSFDDIGRVAAIAHDPSIRRETAVLLECSRKAVAFSPGELGALLRGAAGAVEVHLGAESTQLVWTGPASARMPFRRTDEALLEVVRSAHRVLTLVTFAAYRVPDVRSALEAAIDRGVEVRFVGETERSSDGQLRFDAALALGPALATRARLFEWPRELRAPDPRGLTGRLHAKCALADETMLLVSSANLTESALEANMEMGVLLKGGPLPKLAARHFDDLIRVGSLRPVS